MTAEEYLFRGTLLGIYIEAKRDELKKLNDRAISISGMRLNPDTVQTNHNPQALQDAVIKVVECEERLAELIAELCEFEKQLSEMIEALDKPEHKAILTRYCILGENFEEIGRKLYFSSGAIRYKYRQALKAFEEKHQDILNCKK